MHPCILDLKYGERMTKSQVEVSKTAKIKPPFQRGNGGSITVLLTGKPAGMVVNLDALAAVAFRTRTQDWVLTGARAC